MGQESPSNGGGKGNRRKILVINPRFQFRLMAYFIGLGILSILVFYTANFYFFYKVKEKGVELDLPADHLFYQFVGEQAFLMNVIYAVSSVVLITIITVWSLYISHRIAGPIYRFTRHVKEYTESGELRQIKFREKDFFPEIEEEYNDMVHSIISEKKSKNNKKKKSA